jgi:long-chain acyl-CoA synthetase
MSGLPSEEIVSRKHWLAAYGKRIPAEINPGAYDSVVDMLEAAMKRYAEKAGVSLFRPDTDLR